MVVNFIACLPGAAIIFLGVAFGIEVCRLVWLPAPHGHDRSSRCRYHDDRRRFWHPAVHDLVHRYRCVLLCRLYLRQEPGPEQLGIAIIGAAIALTLFFIDKRIIDAKNAVAAAPAAGAAAPANQ